MTARTTATKSIAEPSGPNAEKPSASILNSSPDHIHRYQDESDTILPRRLQVRQDRGGYRFSIDSVLLPHSLNPRSGETVLDLGTGCGIIALILARRITGIRLFGVEIQSRLAELARKNVTANGFVDRIAIHEGDLRRLNGPVDLGPDCERIDWVVCNPPYRTRLDGRINPSPQKAAAMHEIKVTLADITATTARLLKPGGHFGLIYPAERFVDLVYALRANALEPKQLRWVHPRPGTDAHRVLLIATKKGRPGVKVVPPLDICEAGGEYTAEVSNMFTP